MTNKKLFISIFLSIFLSLTFLSCSTGPDDDCGPFPSSQYDIVGINASVGVIDGNPPDLRGPVQLSPIADGQTVDAEDLVIQFDASTISVGLNQKQEQSIFEFSLIRKANACSPVPPYTNEKISSISITSLTDFSVDYPAGTSLNVLCDVVFNERQVYSTDSATGDTRAYTLAEYVALTPDAGQILQLNLNSLPTESKSHEFYIEYTHVNGEMFSMTTKLVEFN